MSAARSLVVATVPLDGHRGCIGDIAMLARRIPLFPVERVLRLAAVADARAAAARRIGWAAAFLKAQALVARELEPLRTWVARGLTGPRLATSTESVATFAVNRIEEGRERLCFARLRAPDTLPLECVQAHVDVFSRGPFAEVYRRQLELEMVPGILRRAVLRWNLHAASPKRATRYGTYSLSTLAGSGCFNAFHPTLCTTSLAYGPLEPDGRCRVTLISDHRVIDGALAARALARLEALLTTTIAAELRTLPAAPAVPPAAAA